MNQITGIVKAMLQGLMDSITGTTVVFYLDREVNKQLLKQQHDNSLGSQSQPPSGSRRLDASGAVTTIHKEPEKSNVVWRVLNCCMLNGGIFWVSMNLFEYGLVPGVKLILSLLIGGDRATNVFTWLHPAIQLLFGFVWVMPLFIMSRVVNSLWFQDIANSAYKFRKGRPQTIGISKLIADTLFSLVVQLLFLVQSMAVQQLPMQYVGETLAFVHMCLLYSLYSFEYKWFNMGWELHKRLTYIEYNWPYFIGFGVPLAVMTQLPGSYVVSGCVFAIMFPFFILSANEATPVVNACSVPLKLFSPVVTLSNAVFCKSVDVRPQSSPQPTTTRTHQSQQHLSVLSAPPPSARQSVSQLPSGYAPVASHRHTGGSGSGRLPQTVHGVDMSSFLTAAAATASAARRSGGSHRGSPAPSSNAAAAASSSSHRGSPTLSTPLQPQQQQQHQHQVHQRRVLRSSPPDSAASYDRR